MISKCLKQISHCLNPPIVTFIYILDTSLSMSGLHTSGHIRLSTYERLCEYGSNGLYGLS